MKSNSIDKSRNNMMNQVKVNIINNIPKRKPLNCFKNSKPKLIKYKTSSNHINTFKHFNNNNIINDISKYISINKSLLLSAYEKSILILFENLKSYMKNDLKFFNELKENFIKNVQDFYQKKKYEFSTIPNKMKEEIKIDNYINYKTSININKNSRIKSKSNSNITFHKKNKTHFNNSMRKFFSGLSYNSINKSNASIKTLSINNKSKIINNAQKNKEITHKNSLYSLIKSDKQLISNSPIKEITKNNYKFSILNNFIDLKKKNKINSSESTQNGYTIKSEKSNNCSFNKNDVNNYITNLHNNIHNNIYYNKIISQIPNKTNSEKYVLSNDLITRIKNSLDENLKGIFDFSYESFLNKETEREGN